MAGSVNKVILVGNLGKDPEVKSFQNGGKVCHLRIATTESWKDRNSGQKQERTDWHDVSIFSGAETDGLVGIAERFLRKGSKIYVEGQLRTRKWQDQQGNDRYTTEVVLQGRGGVLTMLDSAPGGGGGGPRAGGGGGSTWGDDAPRGSGGGGRPGGGGFGGDGGSKPPFGDDLDDDIPF